MVYDGCMQDINSKIHQCGVYFRLKNRIAQDLCQAIDEYQQLWKMMFKMYTLGDGVVEWNATMQLLSKYYRVMVSPLETQVKEATQFLEDLRYT